jgi:hypothetical protein
MAVINKTGITNGGTVQAEHVTRAIDALSGVSTDTIIATGSLFATNFVASGSVTFNSASISANGAASIDLSAMGTSTSNRGFRIPIAVPTNPAAGSMYFDGASLKIFDGVDWQAFIPG